MKNVPDSRHTATPRLIVTVDAGRSPDALIPHAYATQLEALRQLGCQVHLFAIDDRTSLPGIRRNAVELRDALLAYAPDLVVTYYGAMVTGITRWAVGAASRGSRALPLVVTFRGSDVQGTSNPGLYWRLRDRLSRILSLWGARYARAVVVNGAGLFGSLPPGVQVKAHDIPNGIDVDVFAPLPKEQARQQLGWHSGEKVVLFNSGVGSGQVVKNLPLAQDVIRMLQGSGDLDVRLEQIAALSRGEVCLRMNACDALLVTSLHEGSPDLVKEAMACSLPVVSVPCGDVPERLAGVSLSTICPYDAAALAEALALVFASGERSNGREQLFAQGLDINTVAQRVLAVYQSAIS